MQRGPGRPFRSRPARSRTFRAIRRTFRNDSSELVRLLAWNAPGGHERAFEAMRAKAEQGITDFPSLREVLGHHGIHMHEQATEVAANDLPGGRVRSKVIADRSQGRDASRPDADVRVLLDPTESAGRYEVRDVILSRASSCTLGGALAHTCFYVVSGVADVSLDEQPRRVGPGAFGYLPGGACASIAAGVDEPLHFVTWAVTPG